MPDLGSVNDETELLCVTKKFGLGIDNNHPSRARLDCSQHSSTAQKSLLALLPTMDIQSTRSLVPRAIRLLLGKLAGSQVVSGLCHRQGGCHAVWYSEDRTDLESV